MRQGRAGGGAFAGRSPSAVQHGPTERGQPGRRRLRLFAAGWLQRPGGTVPRCDPAGRALPPARIVPHIRCAPRMRARKGPPMSRHAMQRLSFFLLMGVTLYASLGLG